MTTRFDHHLSTTASVAEYDWTSIVIGTLLIAGLIQQVVFWLDLPVLSGFEVAWNAFVYVMPSSLITGLRSVAGPAVIGSTSAARSVPVTHAEKSQALREVLRLDSGTATLRKATSVHPTAPKGLGNWDNSCYQNSVLQALASLPSMHRFFRHVDLTLGGVPPDSTLTALRTLGTQLNDITGDRAYYWTPPALKSMNSWVQQDAQEYFSKLVDTMEKDVAGELKEKIQYREATHLSLTDGQYAAKERTQPRRKPNDDDLQRAAGSASARAVQTPFEGLFAQRVGCTECGHTEGLSLIPFNCLTVPLGRESEYTLSQCLNEATQLEDIDGVECARCSLLQARNRLEMLLSKNKIDCEPEGAADSAQQNVDSPERQTSLIAGRLSAIKAALQDDDYTEETLAKKCFLTKQHRKSSRKSKQAAVMRGPQCLVIHVNRSMFDEQTFAQLKNHAFVRFPMTLDLSPWCVGSSLSTEPTILWEMDPGKPLVSGHDLILPQKSAMETMYRLTAVITHYGRHENGHYICYRQSPRRPIDQTQKAGDAVNIPETDQVIDSDADQWWRLSDETVTPVSEADLAAQGGAFMLFYERDHHLSAVPAVNTSETNVKAEDATSSDGDLSPDADATSQTAESIDSQMTADAHDKSNASSLSG